MMSSFVDTAMSAFASTIVNNKYAHDLAAGRKETWPEIARRVVTEVVGPYMPRLVDPLIRLVENRQFMPGGRYLYAAGKRVHQVNNCLAGETKVVTDAGVIALRDLVGQTFKVRNRFGRWENATAKAFGRQKLYRVRFKNGDEVLATADHRWWQADGTRVTTAELQRCPLTRPASVPALDEGGVRHGIVFGDGCLPTGANHSHFRPVPHKECLVDRFTDETRKIKVGGGAVLTFQTVRRSKSSGLRHVELLPKHYKEVPDPARCTPEYARGFIAGLIATDGSTKTSTVTVSNASRDVLEKVREIAVLGGCVVTQLRKGTAGVNHINKTGEGPWLLGIKPFSAPVIRPDQAADMAGRKLRPAKMWLDVESVEDAGRTEEVYCCVVPGSESFTLANGLTTSNCFLFRVLDSKEDWGRLMSDVTISLMTGGGVGVVYSSLRGEETAVTGMGGKSSGPLSLMHMVNEAGRHIIQGGSRRSAVWAGLHWWHPDCPKFIRIKDWSDDLREMKGKDFNFPCPIDGTNVSVILDSDFFAAMKDPAWSKVYRIGAQVFTVTHRDATERFYAALRRMLKTGEPGFSVDDGKDSECLRNACTEVTSEDDGDMCNLGSLNLARFSSRDEFAAAVELGTAFLVCGTLYSVLPVERMYKIREKNRRLGLGVMGVHEWLLRRGRKYGPDAELGAWLSDYAASGVFAADACRKLGVSSSVATRAVAPNGTIGIAAETTTSGEPLFAAAYKRRYLVGREWRYQFVVDATAHRLVSQGVDPDMIEDAYTLAEDPERRVTFQTWLQKYVDHGISSTINLPAWGTEFNNDDRVKPFGEMLLKHLPGLRGITAYPDGARGGQPLTRVNYRDAIGRVGVEFEESAEMSKCMDGICGV